MSSHLSLSPLSAEVSYAPTALVRRDELVSRLRSLSVVVSAADATAAASLTRDCSEFLHEVESARKEVKAPLRALAARIDGAACALADDITTMADVLKRSLGSYEEERRRREEDARREAADRERKAREDADRIRKEEEEKARRERDRIEREAAEKRRKIEEEAKAERDRLDAAAAKAKSEKRRNELEAEKRKIEEEAEAARAEVEADRNDAQVAAADTSRAALTARQDQVTANVHAAQTQVMLAEVAKPKQIALRREVRWEVTDIVALYEAAPTLVVMSPNVAALKRQLLSLAEGQTLPGVRHYYEAIAMNR